MSFPAWRGAYLTRSRLCGLVRVASVLAIAVAPLSVVDAGAARGAEARSRTGGETLLIGGYGRDGVVRVDGTTGARRTILAMTAPTAMIADRRRGTVYVASELSGGRTNLRVLNRAGKELGRGWTGGTSPVALALSPSGDLLAVANYDGLVAVLALGATGLPVGEPIVVPTRGQGPNAKRQASSHPHGVDFSPDGRQLYVADLGGDQVLRFHIDTANRDLRLAQTLAMVPGSGPRHVIVQSGVALVASELDSHVDVLQVGPDGALTAGTRLALAAVGAPSQIAVHPSGRWAVALLRAPDLCFVLRLDTPPVTVSPGVACPGSARAAIWGADGRLYVAAPKANRVDAYRFDPRTGVLTPDQSVADVKGAAGLALL